MTIFNTPTDLDPNGIIRPFFGQTTDVPDGWVVCDGNNGTEDLRDKYIKSTPSSTSLPGSTGGQHSVTLSISQMAQHGHGGGTDSAGSHSHSFEVGDINREAGVYGTPNEVNSGNDENSFNSSYGGNHSHTMSVSNTGSGNSFDNRPSFVETLFIKKI